MQPQNAAWVSEHLLQHADDLDFVQDILTATGNNAELNPILNGVLAGFARRKKYGRFKCGQLNLDFDRLRYANTITPKDSDTATMEKSRKEKDTKATCHFFSKEAGCSFGTTCRFKHRCFICRGLSHGATNCPTTTRPKAREEYRSGGRQENRTTGERERPPNPRTRRQRAYNTNIELN